MIRSNILWEDMTKEERDFYKEKCDEYIKAQMQAGTPYERILDNLAECILFCNDNGRIYIVYDSSY